VLPHCARCQQFFHVAANCQAPPFCAHWAKGCCSCQCEKRFEPNYVPTCAKSEITAPNNLMEKETSNKPQSGSCIPNQIIDSLLIWAQREIQLNPSILQALSLKSFTTTRLWITEILERAFLFYYYTNAKTSPTTTLRFISTAWPSSKYTFVPHVEIPQLHYKQDPRLALKTKLHL
jgi:hypothetical protein